MYSLLGPDDTLFKVIPANDGESVDSNPKSILVFVPLTLDVNEPCWFDTKVELEIIPLPSVICEEPLTVPLGSEDITCAEPESTPSTFNFVFTLVSEY